ncbi:MAG: DUF1961 family protein [Butyrivibrio sp.]|nr:DUF1961 family protein [Butyrivibrio sp.]
MSKLIYNNPLESSADIKDFVYDQNAEISFPDDAMRIVGKNGEDKPVILWCPVTFPADVKIEWEFRPLKEPGEAEFIFAIKDENAYYVSFFRRKSKKDRAFHMCKLIKDKGAHMVAEGPDPLPTASDKLPWYKMCIIKQGNKVTFLENETVIFEYRDDGISTGDILTGGSIGVKQSSTLTAEYRNLKVTWI